MFTLSGGLFARGWKHPFIRFTHQQLWRKCSRQWGDYGTFGPAVQSFGAKKTPHFSALTDWPIGPSWAVKRYADVLTASL